MSQQCDIVMYTTLNSQRGNIVIPKDNVDMFIQNKLVWK